MHKFDSFDSAEKAEVEFYRDLSGNEKLQMLLDLIMPENPHEAVIQRSARIYPLIQNKRASHRAKDLGDIHLLEQTRPAGKKTQG